jgi:hypothetical protein
LYSLLYFLAKSFEGLVVAGSSTAMSDSGARVEKMFNNTQSLPNADVGALLKTALETSIDTFPTPYKKTELPQEANPGCRCSHRPSNKYLCNVG